MSDELPSYHERLEELSAALGERGALGVLVLDATVLGEVEYEYGTTAFEEVRQRVLHTLQEQRGKDFRTTDVVALETPHGLRILLFLDQKRRKAVAVTATDLRTVRTRLIASMLPSLTRAAFPYVKSQIRIDVGYGMAIHNPLVHPERALARALREALETATHLRRSEELAGLERIQDLIAGERLFTAYQPILSLRQEGVLGFEALSRGMRGTGCETAAQLFGAAAEHHLLLELDRLCRRKALLNSSRLPSNARLFVNTLPATIRDPQFKGKPLIDFLDQAHVDPRRIVIEITENLVIENYSLFREAMAYFTDLGMAFAVDDVGSGYSGLESIARLRPAFLKIDMSLVRDVHASLVNREMVKAIVGMGRGIGSQVIAEGIQTREEADAVTEIGADYGQGFYLGRPDRVPE
jgi:EAL domain-containing protein (putative c-di-GMP-specific phosphodiesterase class I)